MACIHVSSLSFDYCIIRKLEPIKSADETPVMTEYDCPIYSLSSEVYVTSPISLLNSVSFVHVCSDLCRINAQSFVHDFSTNNLFCFNIFCTGNY